MIRFLSSTLQTLLTLSLGVWLGSLVMLLVGVTSLFGAYPRASGSDVAIDGAPVLFGAGERVQWIAGAIALLACAGWRMLGCSKLRKILLWLVLSGLIVAVASSVFISSRINQLREAGQSQTAEFRSMHGYSNVAYLVQMGLVLGATAVLPMALRQEERGCAMPGEKR